MSKSRSKLCRSLDSSRTHQGAFALALAVTGLAAAAQPVYTPFGPTSSGGTFGFSGVTDLFRHYEVVQGGTAIASGSDSTTGFLGARFSSDGSVAYLNSPNALETFVYGVNTVGTSVGYAQTLSGGGLRPVEEPIRWNRDGTPTSLGLLGIVDRSSRARANAINESGTIVGYSSFDTTRSRRAVRWNAGSTTPVELLSPPGAESQAVAISNSGFILGSLLGGRNIRWDPGSTNGTLLDPIAGGSAVAISINDSGVVVGFSSPPTGTAPGGGRRAVRWEPSTTTPTVLNSLSYDTAGNSSSIANDVNVSATVVGQSTRYSGDTSVGNYATRWVAGSAAAEQLALPVGSTATTSNAVAINDLGYIAGTVGGSFSSSVAVVWDPSGNVIDLNSLIDPNSGWSLRVAQGISNDNWVTGYGLFDPDGPGGVAAQTSQFLVQVPEPTSALAGGAMACLLLRRRA